MNKNSISNHARTIALGLVVMLLIPVITTASAQAPTRVKVIIAFSQQPGPAEHALVHSLGGEIKYSYHLVPAIAASVPEAALQGLRRNPLVIAVEPDLQAQIVDAELDSVWGVKRIGAGAVHDAGNLGAGVKVGILDTGIDLDHPDLTYDPSCSASFVEGETLDDGHSHGTHVAGTIAGLDNQSGVVGVAPAATLCIYKVFSNSGNADYSDIIAALERAVTDGVQVTNNSYGSSSDPGITVKAAYDNAYAAGVLHIGAAGNNGNFSGTGENCIYPARWATVIATGATTSSEARAYFSSTCPEVELAAPGEQIYSALPGGGYGFKSGTSMASPHAAGAAALVLAANPGWSNEQVRAQLQSTAEDLGAAGRDPWYGFGLVDADQAAGFPDNPPVAEDQVIVTDEDTPIGITLTASDMDGDTLTFSVVTGPTHGALSGAAPNLTYTPDANYNGSDSFTFKANDGQLDSNIAAVTLTISAVNDNPVAYDQSVSTPEGTPKDIMLTAGDADGDPLTYHVVTGPAHGILGGTAPQLTYSPTPAYDGADSFTFVANDGQADSNFATVSITINPVSPADTVTILKATYSSRKQKLDIEATSSAGKDVTLTVTAYDEMGNSLGSVTMVYSARRNKFTATLSGLATKPYRIVVNSSGGGSASMEGGAIGGR